MLGAGNKDYHSYIFGMLVLLLFNLELARGQKFASFRDFKHDEFDAENVTVTSVTSAVSPTQTPLPIIVPTTKSLNADKLPQFVFTVHSNTSVFSFDLDSIVGDFRKEHRLGSAYEEYQYGHDSFNFKMSIAVEKMTCYQTVGRKTPELVVQGYKRDQSFTFCSEFDNTRNSFQTVKHLMDDVISLTVRAEGDWTDLSATLVASIYYEVTGGCENCANGYFCCGTKGACATTRQYHNSMDWNHEAPYKFRCIPITALSSVGTTDRRNDLICNHHPNCGFYCNADESKSTCTVSGGGDCEGPDCQIADVAIRIAVLILFCFLLPPLLILIACRFKSARRICDRINQRVSDRFRRGRGHSQSTIGSMESTEERHHPPRIIASAICCHERSVRSHNPEDDPPPSYEDYLRVSKKSEPPPPPFEEAFPPQTSSIFSNDDATNFAVANTRVQVETEIQSQANSENPDRDRRDRDQDIHFRSRSNSFCDNSARTNLAEETFCEAVNPQVLFKMEMGKGINNLAFQGDNDAVPDVISSVSHTDNYNASTETSVNEHFYTNTNK